MSKDFFKVKKGLHIKPTDPTTLTDLEDGDIIVDSTDNQLKKYSEEDGEFSTISGSGGTVANFFADFDKLTPTVSNASVADDSVTFLPIDDNKKSKKATFSAAGSVLYEVASEADLEGNQGLMTVWIKTSLDSVTVSTTTDGVVQSTLSVLGTNKWKQYEIPFVVGGTDQGLIVEAGEAGDVFIDEPFVGLAPAGYTSKIATTITDWQAFDTNITGASGNPTFGNLTTDIVKYRRIGDSIQLSITKIQNTAGVNGSGTYLFSLPAGLEFADTSEAQTIGHGYLFNGNDRSICSVLQRVGSNNTFQMSCIFDAGENTWGSGYFGIGTNANLEVNTWVEAKIAGWSTDYSTVVTQDIELTAKTANELTARIAENGSIISDNYDFLSNCSESSTSPYAITCNFSPNLFSVIPSCTASVLSGANVTVQHTAKIEQLSTSSIELRRNANDDVPSQVLGIELHCSKQRADVNKSATIVGKFENINSSDLVKVRARMNDAQSIATNSRVDVIYKNKLEDNFSAYNNVTGVFTSPKETCYAVKAGLIFDTGFLNDRIIDLSICRGNTCIGASDEARVGDRKTTQSSNPQGSVSTLNFCMLKDEQFVIGTFHNNGTTVNTLNTAHLFNELSITELPDTSSIVKNLLAESSQTKCQTKYLSGSVINSVSDIADLKFNNLEIGKKYSIEVRANITAVNDNIAYIEFRNNNSLVAIAGSGNSSGTTNSIFTATGDFTASATEVISSSLSIGGSSSIFGNGLKDSTHVRLCQLSDTVVDTEEF